MPIQIGDILGDYEVTGILGRGGMGKVFRVRSLLTDREEAMKVVLPDLDENPGLAERFLREIKVHASLQHPNIAALHTALRVEGRLVMIMELVEGVTLEETLQRGPVQVPLAVHYIAQVLAALEFAHERGVIHRDIKPANILIAAGGVVKLTDFGIARSATGVRLTGTGLAVGTLAFMSPEQVRTGETDARSDIYSLGLTFYEMVTGRRPICGDTELALMNAQLTVMPPEPAAVNPMVPQFVSAAIMRALAKDPAMRFQTAREFQAALQPAARPPAPTPVPAGAGSTTVIPAELADLETRLARAIGPIARRLVADAARRYGSMSEIRQVLAAQIEDPKERAAFLKTNPGLTMTVAMPTPTPAPVMTFDPAMLERLTQVLAPYLGPIAKVMVTRAARSARSAEELQNALAAEISPDDERRRFLAAARAVL
ncbi:MAG: serine/threonine-protein kinase [Candidatus Sulfopaludibacter sp.]|nr:serine/threonine-protein kinase [Candidatus Sulfopaludibacter sp.]